MVGIVRHKKKREMKPLSLKAKKIIAREFLLLTCGLALCVVAYLVMFIWNSFKEHQIDHYKSVIASNTKEADSLGKKVDSYASLLSKRHELYNEISKTYDVGTFNDFSKDIQTSSSQQSLYNIISTKCNVGTIESFENSVNIPSNMIPFHSDSIQYAKGEVLLSKNSDLENYISSDEKQILSEWYYTLMAFIAWAIIVYPIRLFVTSLNWSIKTIQISE